MKRINLKNGTVSSLNIETNLKDNEIFSFYGKIIYESEIVENYGKYITLSFIGKGRIIKGFESVEIINNITFDDDLKNTLSNMERFELFENLIKNELNSYEILEKLSLQKMNFKTENKLTLNIENIKINFMDYDSLNRNGIVKGSIYTNRKSNISEINIFTFNIKIELNSYSVKVVILETSSVYELEEYENELLKEYLTYYIENNNYIRDFINNKKLDLFTF